jgi:hypothetical protein
MRSMRHKDASHDRDQESLGSNMVLRGTALVGAGPAAGLFFMDAFWAIRRPSTRYPPPVTREWEGVLTFRPQQGPPTRGFIERSQGCHQKS